MGKGARTQDGVTPGPFTIREGHPWALRSALLCPAPLGPGGARGDHVGLPLSHFQALALHHVTATEQHTGGVGAQPAATCPLGEEQVSSFVGGVRSTKPHCQPCPQCWEAKRQSLAGTQRASGLAVIGAGKQLPQGPDLIQGAEGGGSMGGLALRGGAPCQSPVPLPPPSYLLEPLLSSHLTIPLSSEPGPPRMQICPSRLYFLWAVASHHLPSPPGGNVEQNIRAPTHTHSHLWLPGAQLG